MVGAASSIVRPRLRGRLHLCAGVASVAGLVWLVRSASTPRALVAAWVYGIAATLLYLTSATYHVFARSPEARRILQRLDHSMIFVLIAGTFTPVSLLLLDGGWRWISLAAMWAGAVTGIVIKVVAFERLRRLGNALYIVLGWAGLLALPALIHRPGLLVMIAIAGLLYTGGAILFAMKWPRWTSEWFGYHEVWHSLGVGAGAVLFVVNLGLIRGG